MSKKQKPPYLMQIESAAVSDLLVELVTRAAAPAEKADALASLYAQVKLCEKHFERPPDPPPK
jgi:hypothetical protein